MADKKAEFNEAETKLLKNAMATHIAMLKRGANSAKLPALVSVYTVEAEAAQAVLGKL